MTGTRRNNWNENFQHLKPHRLVDVTPAHMHRPTAFKTEVRRAASSTTALLIPRWVVVEGAPDHLHLMLGSRQSRAAGKATCRGEGHLYAQRGALRRGGAPDCVQLQSREQLRCSSLLDVTRMCGGCGVSRSSRSTPGSNRDGLNLSPFDEGGTRRRHDKQATSPLSRGHDLVGHDTSVSPPHHGAIAHEKPFRY